MTWMNLQRTMLSKKKLVVKDYMWQHSIYATFFFKNQSVVDLQYCVHFRYTAKQLSYIRIFFWLYSIIYYYKTLNIIPSAGVHTCSITSVVSDSLTLGTVAREAPLSMRFSRQEYWTGLPGPPPGDLPNLGIEPASPALAGGFFTVEPPGKPTIPCVIH